MREGRSGGVHATDYALSSERERETARWRAESLAASGSELRTLSTGSLSTSVGDDEKLGSQSVRVTPGREQEWRWRGDDFGNEGVIRVDRAAQQREAGAAFERRRPAALDADEPLSGRGAAGATAARVVSVHRRPALHDGRRRRPRDDRGRATGAGLP